jgi:signal transduction histidine kinase
LPLPHYDTALAQASQLALESPLATTLERVPPLVAAALGLDAAVVAFGGGRADLAVRAAHGVASAELDGVLDALADTLASAPPHGAQPLARVPGFATGLAARLFDVAQPLGAVLALARAPRALDRDAGHFLQQIADVLASAVQRHRTQEQLAHAQRLDAVGQLTGGIAHDFNNLLTVISGNLQLLEAQLPANGDATDVIASALRAVGRGAELTRKLLAFARRQRLSPRAIAPRQLLVDVGLMLRRTLGEQVDLSIHCDDDVGAVFADPAQLDAALVNLALNARDAMPRGGRIAITARRERVGAATDEDARPGDYVVFAVADTGLGMAPEVQARAFEPFFTTKEHGKGSGLGLSMVYGFVKQSGGHLTVDSRLGYGTRIELFLPASAPAAAPIDTPAGALPRRGHERVLVVEDEPEVRGIALAFLRSLGYEAVAAADAEEALDVLRGGAAVDVLFSDVVLGAGAGGGELAIAARALRPGLPVLLTSGYERPAGERVQPTADFPLLRKPYRREELAEALRQVLDQPA